MPQSPSLVTTVGLAAFEAAMEAKRAAAAAAQAAAEAAAASSSGLIASFGSTPAPRTLGAAGLAYDRLAASIVQVNPSTGTYPTGYQGVGWKIGAVAAGFNALGLTWRKGAGGVTSLIVYVLDDTTDATTWAAFRDLPILHKITIPVPTSLRTVPDFLPLGTFVNYGAKLLALHVIAQGTASPTIKVTTATPGGVGFFNQTAAGTLESDPAGGIIAGHSVEYYLATGAYTDATPVTPTAAGRDGDARMGGGASADHAGRVDAAVRALTGTVGVESGTAVETLPYATAAAQLTEYQAFACEIDLTAKPAANQLTVHLWQKTGSPAIEEVEVTVYRDYRAILNPAFSPQDPLNFGFPVARVRWPVKSVEGSETVHQIPVLLKRPGDTVTKLGVVVAPSSPTRVLGGVATGNKSYLRVTGETAEDGLTHLVGHPSPIRALSLLTTVDYAAYMRAAYVVAGAPTEGTGTGYAPIGTAQPRVHSGGVSMGRLRSLLYWMALDTTANKLNPAAAKEMLRRVVGMFSGDSGAGTHLANGWLTAMVAAFAARGIALVQTPGLVRLIADEGATAATPGPVTVVQEVNTGGGLGQGTRAATDLVGVEMRAKKLATGDVSRYSSPNIGRVSWVIQSNKPGHGIVERLIDGVAVGELDAETTGTQIGTTGLYYTSAVWTGALATHEFGYRRKAADGRATAPRIVGHSATGGTTLLNEIYAVQGNHGGCLPSYANDVNEQRWAVYQALGLGAPMSMEVHLGGSIWRDAADPLLVNLLTAYSDIKAALANHVAGGRTLWAPHEGASNKGPGILYALPAGETDDYTGFEAVLGVMTAAAQAVGPYAVDTIMRQAILYYGTLLQEDPFDLVSDTVHPTQAAAAAYEDFAVRNVYLGGMNAPLVNAGGLTAALSLTQAAYDALAAKDATTLYATPIPTEEA